MLTELDAEKQRLSASCCWTGRKKEITDLLSWYETLYHPRCCYPDISHIFPSASSVSVITSTLYSCSCVSAAHRTEPEPELQSSVWAGVHLADELFWVDSAPCWCWWDDVVHWASTWNYTRFDFNTCCWAGSATITPPQTDLRSQFSSSASTQTTFFSIQYFINNWCNWKDKK